jgi:hypothetical protein
VFSNYAFIHAFTTREEGSIALLQRVDKETFDLRQSPGFEL